MDVERERVRERERWSYCTRTSRFMSLFMRSPPNPSTSSSSPPQPSKAGALGTITTSSPLAYSAVARSGRVEAGSRNLHRSSSSSSSPPSPVTASDSPNHHLHHARTDLYRLGPHAAPYNETTGCRRNESEAVGILGDGNVSVGPEGELQHLAEYVGQAAELPLPAKNRLRR
ncbi:hypothetical protein HPP92_005852 [Vanilla planifolia]|uniref:Uncharacterized protein n=1 Tax=Vanilla planifolia TaxID=51239 RepID=A0A835VF43_VANPL|nr:hypothetical protein HPP92_006115 [Vanilla planifolia]KAG0494858.1 hypothetical protein HPP92_005852 [Vanilla planifolia]